MSSSYKFFYFATRLITPGKEKKISSDTLYRQVLVNVWVKFWLWLYANGVTSFLISSTSGSEVVDYTLVCAAPARRYNPALRKNDLCNIRFYRRSSQRSPLPRTMVSEIRFCGWGSFYLWWSQCFLLLERVACASAEDDSEWFLYLWGWSQ